MSHQRYLSHDPIKEPHSVSVKVLRLSCPSLVPQYPIEPPFKPSTTTTAAAAAASAAASPLPASLAYHPSSTNPSPFLLSPILNLPVSFGSAYVGETFSCTLCANNDLDSSTTATKRQIRDVRVEAEMKTPGQAKAQSLELGPAPSQETAAAAAAASTDLAPGGTLQKIVSFDLKEEGNHVLAVTVSYYEAAETSGRTRTFRKLYQFICKPSLIVRTKVGVLEAPTVAAKKKRQQQPPSPPRRWVLEAQLENCSDDTMQLDRVVMELEPGLTCRDCNWTAGAGTGTGTGTAGVQKPVLQPGEVEQVCFVVETRRGGDDEEKEQEDVVARAARAPRAAGGPDARVVFGVLGIGWRGEMGNRGFLSTGKLGTRVVR